RFNIWTLCFRLACCSLPSRCNHAPDFVLPSPFAQCKRMHKTGGTMQPHHLDLQTHVKRIGKLEAQTCRLKKTGIAVAVLISAVLFMGQEQTNRVVEANAFHLMDASGKIRAQLSMEMSGPILSLLDARGSPVVSLAGGDKPVLVLNKPGTTEQVQLGTNKTHIDLGLYDT